MTSKLEWDKFQDAYKHISRELEICLRTPSEQNLARVDAYEQALAEMRDAFMHNHVSSDNGDTCALCGLDIQNEIHSRV